jgi:hypothetical protein
MRPPSAIGIFDETSEAKRMKTFNFRVAQEHYQTTVNPILGDKHFQMPTDIRSQNNIGINTNPLLMSLGCRDVDMANNLVIMGSDTPFNGSNYNITPPSWNSEQSLTSERFGFSHNFKQPAMTINTWR